MKRFLPIAVALILFFLPFFWFKPGEMDLGGDSSRLYFYDPVSYLKNYSLFSISPSGFGTENIGFYSIPFVLILILFKTIVKSPTVIISLTHGLNLSACFYFVYLSAREMISHWRRKPEESYSDWPAIVAGLLYIFSPISIYGWDKALMTVFKIFLNPLMFYLLLRNLVTGNFLYLLAALSVSFLFAQNFSYVAAPAVFSFYPLALVFLLLYSRVILGKRIQWKQFIIAFFLFVFLHAFHLIPQIYSTTSRGSVLNTTIFSEGSKIDRGLTYFTGILNDVKVSNNWLLSPQFNSAKPTDLLFVYLPMLVLFALTQIHSLSKRQKQLMLLTVFFFLATFYFASANITEVGVTAYKAMFKIPGFSMFRNFYGQWVSAFLFFYCLLFAQALVVCSRRPGKLLRPFLVYVLGLFLLTAWPFIKGELINPVLWKSKNLRILMTMDPQYETFIGALRNVPGLGKVLSMPLSDPGYQIVAGTSGGAYQGPSTISYLTGKQDFAGASELGAMQETVLRFARQRNFESLRRALGFMNIGAVFYNADTRVYDDFPRFPYEYVRRFLPATQKDYQNFMREWNLPSLYTIDDRFFLYSIPKEDYYPPVFVADTVTSVPFDQTNWEIALSFMPDGRHAFVDGELTSSEMDRELVVIYPETMFSRLVKNPDPSRIIVNPAVRNSPLSFLYPLVTVKEKILLRKRGDYDYPYLISQRLLLAAKRIAELEQWGAELAIVGNVIFPEPRRLGLTPAKLTFLPYSSASWEATLVRYKHYVEDNVEAVSAAQESNLWKLEQRFNFAENIRRHRSSLIHLISTKFAQAEEKPYLTHLVDELFDELEERVASVVPDPSKVTYTPAGNVSPGGVYDVFTKAGNEKGVIVVSNDVPMVSKRLNLRSALKDWYHLGAIPWEQGAIEVSWPGLFNILNVSERVAFETVETSSDSASITVDSSTLPLSDGFTWRLSPWQETSLYLLSFSYKTGEEPFRLQLYEHEISDTRGAGSQLIIDDELRSIKWKTYQAVIRSGQFVNDAFMRISSAESSGGLSQMQLKDIRVVKIPQEPLVLIRETDKAKNPNGIPEITLEKHSPIKYTVTVNKAKEPYMLVLNQEFNANWKIFFNNTPIATTKHWRANAHSNAWYITPEEVNGKETYMVTIEFATQRYFLVGAVISLVTLMSIVGYFGLMVVMRIRR